MATDSQKKLDVLLVVFLLVALGGLAILFYKSQSRAKATPPPATAVPVVPPAIAPEKVPPPPVPPPTPAEAIEAPRPPTIAPPKVIPPPATAALPPKIAHFHKAAPLAGIGAGTIAGQAGSAVAPAVPPPVTAPVTPPPPPPAVDDATRLDQALAQLKPGNLAYSTPTQMKLATTAHVVAMIATNAVSAAALQAAVQEATPTDAGTQVAMAATSITPKMKMTLASADFDITPLSSEEQMVAGTAPTTWAWDIVPKHSGDLQLHLAATIELNGLAKDFTTVDREIAVQVDPADVVEDFMQANWQWLIATLTGIFGAVWRYFAGRKKAAAVAA